MSTKINLIKKKKFKNPVMVVGLPGIGLVGKIAADYILKQSKAEKIGVIYSDSFPPSVQTTKGKIELVCDELHYIKTPKNDVLFLTGPVQPSLDLRNAISSEHYEFANEIIKQSKKMGVKRIYTLAGINIGDKRIVKESKLVIAATNDKILKEMKKHKITKTEDNGFISGVAGLLLGLGKEVGIEGACIMGETNAKMIYGDQGAAKKVIEVLANIFELKIKMDSIEKDSLQIEEAFTELTKQLTKKTKKDVLLEDSDLSYVR